MRAYIKDGLLHVVIHESMPEETIFDEEWTTVMRRAFYQELNDIARNIVEKRGKQNERE